jgi:hypothetical protein
MRLLELKLCGILDGDDALTMGNEYREDIEERGFARAGPARDENVESRTDDGLERFGDGRRDSLEPQEIVDGQFLDAEFPDGEDRTVDRERRYDRVTREPSQSCIDHGRCLTNPTSRDPVDDIEHHPEHRLRKLELAEPLT